MAFNHKFPDAVPALDTAGLVKLISDPKKAAELWGKYEQARAEYEALRAAVKAEADAAGLSADALEKKKAELEADLKAFSDTKVQFSKDKLAWETKRASVEKAAADRVLELDGKAAALGSREKMFEEAKRLWVAHTEQENVELASAEKRLEDLADAVAAREEAVAAREAKADALAKLLKGV
jgi:chromosome segregation ATPase